MQLRKVFLYMLKNQSPFVVGIVYNTIPNPWVSIVALRLIPVSKRSPIEDSRGCSVRAAHLECSVSIRMTIINAENLPLLYVYNRKKKHRISIYPQKKVSKLASLTPSFFLTELNANYGIVSTCMASCSRDMNSTLATLHVRGISRKLMSSYRFMHGKLKFQDGSLPGLDIIIVRFLQSVNNRKVRCWTYRDLYSHDIEMDHPRRDRFHADSRKFSFYLGHRSGLTSKTSYYMTLIVVVFLVVIIAYL